MKDFFETLFQTKNVVLTEVQEKVLSIPENKNVLILSPCGSGKTEASLYLLSKWGGRTIYVQPQKTLATSIYHRLKRYKDLLGMKETWTIQHSSLQEDPFLSNPYVVTTIDQVLAGYLGIGIQAYIKGKNVVQSNFVFDEIQLFEPGKTLKTTILMLDALYKRGNRFIIMTATMPSYLIKFLSNRYNMEVVIAEKEAVKDRHMTIRYVESLDFEEINQYEQKQIIICNTQKEQLSIYEKIKDKSRCILLNSKLLRKDRKKVEEEVLKYFGKDSGENNKILISTQVIEAGMDISAPRIYSSVCSIDALIQRAGRGCRWGGRGEIICFKGQYQGVYDEEIVEKTIQLLKENQNIEFTWDIQKQWVNEVLNPYYQTYINERELRRQRPKLRDGSRSELIRGIENINVIVDPNPSIESFEKDSVSIHTHHLKTLAKWNTLYILERNHIKEVPFSQVSIGETVVIKGIGCFYDEAGFRIEEGAICREFPPSEEKKEKVIYSDYKEEPWILHAKEVRRIMKEKLKKDDFSDYVRKHKDWIAEIAGLHDIGKLDVVWQGKHWANATTVPLAHFPMRKGNPLLFKDRNHAIISAHILKPHVDFLLMNMVLQHHRRYINDGTCIHLSEYELDPRYKECLDEYGFHLPIKESDKNRDLSYSRDVIHPAHEDWVEFVYLVGTLMEADIEAIQNIQATL
jgi:CRISPR-associated endonuclease/helicase Cas3